MIAQKLFISWSVLWSNIKEFARKLIRPSVNVTRGDILSEIQAIDKLYKSHRPKRLIRILEHAWLPRSTDYYMDMELCAYNLDAWIRNNMPLYQMKRSDMDTSSYRYRLWDSDLGDMLEDGLIIMLDISKGLEFIHRCKLVHRDLNPRNGISTPPGNNLHSSIIFGDGQSLESFRLRIHFNSQLELRDTYRIFKWPWDTEL